jgi:hypothetical protein
VVLGSNTDALAARLRAKGAQMTITSRAMHMLLAATALVAGLALPVGAHAASMKHRNTMHHNTMHHDHAMKH